MSTDDQRSNGAVTPAVTPIDDADGKKGVGPKSIRNYIGTLSALNRFAELWAKQPQCGRYHPSNRTWRFMFATQKEGKQMKMRRAILGMCLVTMFAMAGTNVAAAAPPEFTPPFPNTFSSTGKAMKLEVISNFEVTCKADTNSGEVTGLAPYR